MTHFCFPGRDDHANRACGFIQSGMCLALKRGWQARKVAAAFVLVASLGGTLQHLRAQAPISQSARIWTEQRRDIEEYLRTADVVKIDKINVGVTTPRRAYTAPGGPVESFTWKPIAPGRYNGYWESYKSEIAAYELDKVLALDMFPPVVERKVDGQLGAAVMWVSPTKSFKQLGGIPRPPPAERERWNMQIIRAKMIDDLIANTDPNLGNWLVDPAWNIILIDHSRAFTSTQKMTHELTRIDADLWARMQALDQNGLAAALGAWLSKDEIDALLRRRDTMKTNIDKLVAKRGEAEVFVR
jgi:hypothetical protein